MDKILAFFHQRAFYREQRDTAESDKWYLDMTSDPRDPVAVGERARLSNEIAESELHMAAREKQIIAACKDL